MPEVTTDIKSGTKWIGTDGWVHVDRGVFEGSNEDWRDYKTLPEELRKVKLYLSTNHQKNFLECVKSRKPTITPVETAHHSAIPGHLGPYFDACWPQDQMGRGLRNRLGDDPEASKLLGRDYRAPYKLG